MDVALSEAEAAAARGEVPIGAVVALGDTIVAQAGNRTRELNDPTAHAEMLAIREAAATLSAERLGSADLYVTLEPCTMCAARFPSRASAGSISARPTKRAARWSAACASLPRRPATMRRKSIRASAETRSAELLRSFFRERRGVGPEQSLVDQNGLRSLQAEAAALLARLALQAAFLLGLVLAEFADRRVGGGLPVVERRLAQEFARASGCPAGFPCSALLEFFALGLLVSRGSGCRRSRRNARPRRSS